MSSFQVIQFNPGSFHQDFFQPAVQPVSEGRRKPEQSIHSSGFAQPLQTSNTQPLQTILIAATQPVSSQPITIPRPPRNFCPLVRQLLCKSHDSHDSQCHCTMCKSTIHNADIQEIPGVVSQ